jgi:hypothetical protein
VNAPHWQPQIEELPPKEQEDVEEMLEDVDKVREDPAGYGDEAYVDQIEDDEDEEDEEGEYDLLPVVGDDEDEEAA